MTKCPSQQSAGMVSEFVLVALVTLVIVVVGVHRATHLAAASGTVVELKNTVEDLPASTVKVFSFVTPAEGVVNLELLVHRGPAIGVRLTSRSSGEAGAKANESRLFVEFSADDVTTYRRSGSLPRGEYFLALVNPAQDPASITKVRIFARFVAASKAQSKL